MGNFTVATNKDLIDIDLLLREEPSLPETMRLLNLCEAFIGMQGGRPVAVCLVTARKNYYDIVRLAVDPRQEDTGAVEQLLMYIVDYVRVQGGRFVEVGTSSAELRRHALLLSLGFRVVGIWKDYYTQNGRDAVSQGKPAGRDMLRYRIDLNELPLA